MKSPRYLILISLVNVCLFIHCAPEASDDSPASLVINTWKLKEFTPAAQFPMPDSVRQEIIEKTVMEYTADNKFKQTGIGRTHTGTYEISADGKRITYHHDLRDVPFTETVLELTGKRMSVMDQNGNRMVRVSK